MSTNLPERDWEAEATDNLDLQLDKPLSALEPPELPAGEARCAGATGCLDPHCPRLIEAALVKSGWHYRTRLGWSKDHVMYW